MHSTKRGLSIRAASIFCLITVLLVGFSVSCKREAKPAGSKKFYWIQGLKGHPVHQMTQIAFGEACKQKGMDFQVIGGETADPVATIALADQVLAKGDAAGVSLWGGIPAFDPLIERFGKAGVPVILPHFKTAPGPGISGCVGPDPVEFAKVCADAIGAKIEGKGTVAITQGGFNTNENTVAATFTERMKEKYPDVKVLPSEEETFDPSKATSKCSAILSAHPDVVAALSTTGGGATNWANATRSMNRKNVAIIGMDYTRSNLDLIRDGDVFAVVGQPLWEESQAAADLLLKLSKGEKIEYWTKIDAPLVTKDNIQKYYDLQDKVDKVIGR